MLAEQEAAEKELQAVVNEITKQEEARAKKIAKLKKTSETSSSVVAKGKAFQEMKALEGEDPLPLRKAKLTQKAVVKKQKRITKKALKISKKATDAAQAASVAREAADAANTAAAKAEEEATAAAAAAAEEAAAAAAALADAQAAR